MMSGPFIAASNSVLVITAGLLFWMALTDLREFKIRNNQVLVLAGLFFLYSFLSGRWEAMGWNCLFAAGISLLLLACYAARALGGGDAKLLMVAFLWTGYECAIPFLFFVTIASLFVIVAAHFKWIEAQRSDGRVRVPFAPAIATGLIGVFVIGCLAPGGFDWHTFLR